MSYRHYIEILDKDKLRLLHVEDMKDAAKRHRDREEWFDVEKYMEERGVELKEVMELGKYTAEGYYLEGLDNSKYYGEFADIISTLREELAGDGTGFNLITKDNLIWVINAYKGRVVKLWEDTLHIINTSDDIEQLKKDMTKYFHNKIHWKDFLVNTDLENKWDVQNTWTYEYELFNLVHILKTVDWEKQLLFIHGW